MRQRDRLKGVKPASEIIQLNDGSVVPFLGRGITIRLVPDTRTTVKLRDDELFIGVAGEVFPDMVASVVDAWYLLEAKKYFAARTHELAGHHSDKLPEPRTIGVRRMKRRWGSCRTGGDITFNRELLKKDPALVDYVIIHELCHLVHHNHGKEFYTLLESIVPDFRERRRRLQQT